MAESSKRHHWDRHLVEADTVTNSDFATSQKADAKWRPDIQGLRAIGVLSVVLFHARVPGFEGGFVGVDVFFVISGFLITGMLYRPTGEIRFWKFVASRVRRLVPAASLVLLVVVACISLTISPLMQSGYLTSVADAAKQTVNLSFATSSTDYLAGDQDSNPVLNFWTLSLEWQYYLVWALVSLVAIWITVRMGRSHRGVGMALALVGLLGSLVLSVGLVSDAPGDAFFLLQSRLWEFMVGAVLFFVIGRIGEVTRPLGLVLGWFGLAAILIAVFGFESTTPFPGFAALLPVGGAALVILAGAKSSDIDQNQSGINVLSVSALLSLPPFERIGLVSYSWYLWHWPALVFVATWWGVGLGGTAVHSPWLVGLAVLVGAYILSELTYQFVEEPFRRRWLPSTWVSLGFGIGATAAIVALSVVLSGWIAPWKASAETIAVASAAKRDLPKPGRDGCQRAMVSPNSEPCIYGDPDGKKTVALWGDSHAAMWFPPLEKLAKEKNIKLVVWAKGSCPPSFPTDSPAVSSLAQNCGSWNKSVEDQILEMHPNVVILAGMWQGYIPEGKSRDEALSVLRGSLEATVDGLNKNGIPVILMQDVPKSPYPSVPVCLTERSAGECDFEAGGSYNGDFEAAIVEGKNAVVVSYNEVLCPGGTCRAVVKGKVIYRDDDHITGTYGRTLDPDLFWKAMQRLGVDD